MGWLKEVLEENRREIATWPLWKRRGYPMTEMEKLQEALQAKDAEIAGLKEELEYERMRLAACGQAALDNTPQAVQARRLSKDNQYYSASYGDVCTAVDREMALRDANARLRSNLINCSERLRAYYGDNYPAVIDAQHALADTEGQKY